MSKLTFNSGSGLVAPQTSHIRDLAALQWQNAFSTQGGPVLNTEFSTPAGQLIDAFTAEIEAKNADMLYLASQFNPLLAAGRWQDALGQIYFLSRKNDEPTIVNVTLTGLKGTVVPYGALAQSKEGHILMCSRPVTIGEGGKAEAVFRTVQTGPLEIAAHSVQSIITTIAGWDTIDNKNPAVVGRFLETRSEFEARRRASVAANAHGSVSAIYGAIANLAGVLDVAVLENIAPHPVIKYGVKVPGHGIAVCVYGGSDEDIADVLYRKKDAGCDTGGNTELVYRAKDYHKALYRYRIFRPSAVPFWVKVWLGSDVRLTRSLEEAIKKSVFEDFYGLNINSGNPRIGMASTVYASRFYMSVMAVLGNRSLYGIEVCLGEGDRQFVDSLEVMAIHEPVLNIDNVSVLVKE